MKRIFSIILLATIIIGLAGCDNGKQTPVPSPTATSTSTKTPTATPTSTKTPAPTPTATPTPAPTKAHGEFNYKDKDGYTAHVSWTVDGSPVFTKHPEEGKPGYVGVTYEPIPYTITVTNTTPGKNLPVNAYLFFAAMPEPIFQHVAIETDHMGHISIFDRHNGLNPSYDVLIYSEEIAPDEDIVRDPNTIVPNRDIGLNAMLFSKLPENCFYPFKSIQEITLSPDEKYVMQGDIAFAPERYGYTMMLISEEYYDNFFSENSIVGYITPSNALVAAPYHGIIASTCIENLSYAGGTDILSYFLFP